MNSKNLVVLAICFLLIPELIAQSRREVKQAKDAFYKEDFRTALTYYRKHLIEFPDDRDIQYKAEICSLLTDYSAKPLDKLFTYTESEGRQDKFYDYWLGRIYFKKYQFDEAISSFTEFLKIETYKSKEIIDESNRYINWATRAKQFYVEADIYEIEDLSTINTSYSEHSPTYTKDGALLFLSNRPGPNNYASEPQFQPYRSRETENGWEVPEIMEPKKMAERNTGQSGDPGQLLVLNKTGGDTDSQNGFSTDMLIVRSEIKPQPDPGYCTSEKMDRVIFSARTATEGDLNLFESLRLPSGKWSEPVPVSGPVNSKKDETSPYLSADGKQLYFSSRGHQSIGGYDVFISVFDEATNTWGKPLNMGFPINTIDDDIHFKLNKEQKFGFLSSNRLHSKGQFDIYKFWEISYAQIEGLITDRSTGQPLDKAEIRFHPSRYYDESFFSTTDINGKFYTELFADELFNVEIIYMGKMIHQDLVEIHEKHANALFTVNFTVNVPAPEILLASNDKGILADQVFGKTGEVTKVENLSSKFRPGNKAILKNIYFEFGNITLSEESENVLSELTGVLKDSPYLKVEIAGHTCDIGSHELNMEVSRKRAESIRDYLVSSGVDETRLVAKGYGETRPLASNDDEDEGRELNRRIEVVVIE